MKAEPMVGQPSEIPRLALLSERSPEIYSGLECPLVCPIQRHTLAQVDRTTVHVAVGPGHIHEPSPQDEATIGRASFP